jgi:hypothetical protein
MSLIAYEAGWLLGMRSDSSATTLPQTFIDIDYKRPNFEKHLEVVAKYNPKYATVPDLSDTETSNADVDRALKQAERLQQHCEIVLIVPKLSEQLTLIPPEYAIGYSIPTSYGGAKYLPWELAGRRIHILGGSPRKQMETYLHLSPVAEVMSADGNYAQLMATRYGEYWKRDRWLEHPGVKKKEKDIYLECWKWSCENLFQHWRRIA